MIRMPFFINTYKFLNRKVYFTLFNRRKLASEMKKYSNLNIGCGYAPIENWLNIGLFGERDIPYGFIRKRNNCDVLHFDVKARLPIKNESVKYIFAAHFIEHLRYNNGILVLKLMFNYLEKGGVLRITFPDLQIWAANYYLNNSSFFEEYRTKYLKHETMIKTNAEIFMSQVHGHGHLWGYDFESMKHFLEMIGFMDVQKKKISESSIPGIEEIEKAAVIRDFETCYVEALKP